MLTGIAAALCALAIALLVTGGRMQEVAEVTPATPAAHSPMRAGAAENNSTIFTDDGAPVEGKEPEEEPIHYNEHGMDPRDQPRAAWVAHYRPGELPEGYNLHNVELTTEGFVLTDTASGADEPRVGLIESPPVRLDFPFNGFAPMWMEDLPDGTSVLVEVQVSPDGEKWTGWHTAEVEHHPGGTVSEFMPDGTPNPSYGYTAGNVFVRGDLLWNYMRYSIALYSETDESPAVSSLRLFYNDSTMGGGHIARSNEEFDKDF